VRSKPNGDLPEILGHSCEHRRGVGNSFQPAIDASRFHLINCVIAPSAKMKMLSKSEVSIIVELLFPVQRLWEAMKSTTGHCSIGRVITMTPQGGI
jgi:hypothetical protein